MNEKTKEKNASGSSAKKVLKVILNIFIWVFVAFSVVVTILAFAAQGDADRIPTLGKTSFFSVTTNSMEPTIMAGDLIISEKFATDEEKQSLQVGDVITFKMVINGENAFNTHRIISVEGTGAATVYTTKGDNTEDNVYNVTETVPYNLVVRKWNGTRLAGVGSVLAFLQTPNGFLIVIVIPLVLFFLFELVKFIRAAIAVKNEGKKQITAADEELIKQKAVEEYLRQQREKEEANKQDLQQDVSAPEEPKAEQVDEKAEDPKPEGEQSPFEPAAEQAEDPETVPSDLNAAENIAGAAAAAAAGIASDAKSEAEEKVEEIKAEAEDSVSEVKEAVEEKAEEAKEAAEEIKAEACEKAEEANEAVVERAEELENAAEEKAAELEAKAEELENAAEANSEEIADRAEETAEQAAGDAAEKAEEAIESNAKEAVSDLLHKADNE